jgi:hypothetical protein
MKRPPRGRSLAGAFALMSLAAACAHGPRPGRSGAAAGQPGADVPVAIIGPAEIPRAPLGPMGADAVGALHGYMLRLKCGPAQDARSCKLGPEQEKSRLDVVVTGDPDKLYEVRLRVRGLVEPRRYTGGAPVDPANPWLYAGGEPDPGRKNNGHAYNVYQIAVSDPAQHYFLNRDSDNHLGGGYVPSHSVFKIDYPLLLKVKGGATISVITDDRPRSGMINNADKQVVEDIPPEALPQPWDGQFFLITVDSVAPAP